VTEKKYYSN